ncbi:gp58-like family protein [Vagococcus fluvialis]|uniref:gp58-like family protein n=1 Tax=Vagococcus fluvialis TaxID=2738 RepID=UPI003B5C2BA4
MLAVSNAFNEAFKSDLREVKMRIKINDVTYTDEDIISFNFNSGSIVGETFAIGSTYANSIKLTLCKIVEGLKQLDEVIPEMGIVLPDGSIEWVKLGTFIISEEVNPDRNENRTSLECTDKMIMLDDIYESKLNYPAKIRDVALEIANLAGVEVEPVSFGRLMENTIQKPVGYTYRQALGLIAQFEAGYACFDRNGLLAIKTLEDKNYEVTPNEYFQKGLVKNELMFRPAGIQVKVNGESEDEKVLKIGNEKGSVIRLENKVMTEQLLRLVYEKVKDINYYPYSLNWRGNPAVEVGDWLRVTDLKGNQFKVPNLSYSLEYKGGLTATSTVETVASNEVKMGYKTILEQTIEYVNESIKDNGTEISYGVEEPPNPKEGDVWFKYNGPDTEIWIYEKIGEPDIFDWVLKISSAVDDTIKDKIEELEQTSKDISESVDKALEYADIARKEAFNSDKLANEAKKDAYEALQKGNQNSLEISNIDNQLKVSAIKIEENTTRITNIKIENDRLSSVMLETQDSIESLKLSSDRNYILGTSDVYKNISFDGSSAGPTDPEPPEKLVDVQVTGYDEYYNTLYTDVIKAVDGSDKTFYAKSVTGYEIVGQTSKTVKVSSYTKVVFEYKKTGSGGGTPSKKVDVKVQCFDEKGLVINSYTEKHEVNTYVTFVAKDINDYELTSSRTQEIYVNENSIVKFNYKKKEDKPPISSLGENILTGSEKETEIRGAYLSTMEYMLYNLAKPANQSGIALNDLVQVEFEVVSKNISQTGGYMQFAIDNSANLSDYINIDNLPSRGKYTETFRISGSNPQNSTTRSVLARVKDFKTGNNIRIKNLTIKKMTQARMNLQLFSNNLSGLAKIGQIDIDERFSNEPNFLVSCYVDTDYDVGLEIILKNSWGSETKRIKSQTSKRSGFIECEVPYVQGVKTIEVYLANRSTYSYNKGRYKWLQGEIGSARTPWKLAVEELASTTKLSSLEQTVNGFQMNVNNSLDGMNGQLTVMSNQINTAVNQVKVVDGKVSRQETRITQLSNQLDLKVSANEVISRINMSPERIRIDSKLIHLSGQTLIDDAVIKNTMIANGAIDNAKIQDATISSAKIISLDADKINASTLSSITSNTGQLNVTGWLDFTTDNRGLRGTYDFGDPYNNAFNYRWFDGTFRLSHRHLVYGGYIHDVNPDNTKGVRRGSAETYYGLDYIKLRSWGPQNNMLGQVDISSQYFRMSTGFNDTVGILFNPGGGSYFGDSMVVNGDVELRGDTAIKAYTLQARDLANNVYINQGRPDLADFRVGRDGSNLNSGRVVQSLAIYNRTYSGPANMIVHDTGIIGRTTSARKYKLEIETASSVIAKAKKVLSLNPKSWFDKGEVLDGVANKRYFGFIADEFDESGLNEVVIYNECGEVESLAYDRISMYHNVILTDHEKEIKMLNRKIETLEERLYARKI